MKSAQKQAKIVDGKELLMVSLSKFYAMKSHIATVIPIVTGNSEISLRLIDWFVTNYSKKHGTVIKRRPGLGDGPTTHFNVYLSYRSQLKAYSKQQFDPFRRRDRISFCYAPDATVETTIGQLNFFRWVVENGILEYIAAHRQEIEDDMLASQKTTPAEAAIAAKKRCELSKSFVKNVHRFDGVRVVNFT